jgi:hypothetical protein
MNACIRVIVRWLFASQEGESYACLSNDMILDPCQALQNDESSECGCGRLGLGSGSTGAEGKIHCMHACAFHVHYTTSRHTTLHYTEFHTLPYIAYATCVANRYVSSPFLTLHCITLHHMSYIAFIASHYMHCAHCATLQALQKFQHDMQTTKHMRYMRYLISGCVAVCKNNASSCSIATLHNLTQPYTTLHHIPYLHTHISTHSHTHIPSYPRTHVPTYLHAYMHA